MSGISSCEMFPDNLLNASALRLRGVKSEPIKLGETAMPYVINGHQAVWMSEAESRRYENDRVMLPILADHTSPAVAIEITARAALARQLPRTVFSNAFDGIWTTSVQRVPEIHAELWYKGLLLLCDLKNWTEILMAGRNWMGRDCGDAPVGQRFASLATPGVVPEGKVLEDFRGYISQASNGDTMAQAELYELLGTRSFLWDSVIDAARQAAAIFIHLIAGGHPSYVERLNALVVEFRATVDISETELEYALVERLIAAWLHKQWAKAGRDVSKRKRDIHYWNQILEGAHYKFIDAARAYDGVYRAQSLSHSHEPAGLSTQMSQEPLP